MAYSELAKRYASALFSIAGEGKKNTEFLVALKAIHSVFEKNESVIKFVASPLIPAEDKVKAVSAALKNGAIPEDVSNFVLLLAKKNRLPLLPEIVSAYQACEDELDGVTRGTVRSPQALNDAQKKEITDIIAATLKKKVILQYTEDQSLIGGLSAQVGGRTFDDSLSAHLRRIKEDLTRRIN